MMSGRKAKGDLKRASSQLLLPLTEKERKLIKSTWEFIERHWNSICVYAFERWFKSYPELMNVFSVQQYDTIGDMVRSPFMVEHMGHVKGIITYVVENIFNAEKFTEHVLQLGKRHHKYGADPKYAQAFAVSLMYSISVSKQWTLEAQNAWDSLIRYMINTFRIGIRLGAEADGVKCSERLLIDINVNISLREQIGESEHGPGYSSNMIGGGVGERSTSLPDVSKVP